MKKVSTKQDKISGKSRSSESYLNICWICHQEVVNAQSRECLSNVLQSEYVKTSPIFKPCLCKGSIGSVHNECLNRYVLEKYQSYLKRSQKETDEDLPIIHCPNCKTPYDYSVYEVKTFRGLKTLKLISVESICLLVLILIQIGVLVYDIMYSSSSAIATESIDETTTNPNGGIYFKWSQYIHIVTVIIVIAAGGFNLLEAAQKEIQVEVQSKEN